MSNDRKGEYLSASSSADDEVTRAAAAHLVVQLSMPAEICTRLAGVGEVVLHPRFLDRAGGRAFWETSRKGCEVLTLARAGQAAVMFIEHGLAVGVVNAILGLGTPPLAGPLSRIERGVLAGALATALTAIEPAAEIRLAGDLGAEVGTLAPILVLAVRWPGREGRVWLAAGDEFYAGFRSSRESGCGPMMPWLEVAVTTVEESEIESAEPGDTLVFDETKALPPDEAWPIRVRLDERSFPARWLPDGTVVAAEDSMGDVVTRPDGPASLRRGGKDVTQPRREMRVAAGCLCHPVAPFPIQLAPLVVPRGGSLRVEAGGCLWAEGDLAALEGAFALTLTRMLTGSPAGSRTAPPSLPREEPSA